MFKWPSKKSNKIELSWDDGAKRLTYYVITDNNTQCYFNLQSLVIIDFALHNFYLLINYYRMLKNIDDYGNQLVLLRMYLLVTVRKVVSC